MCSWQGNLIKAVEHNILLGTNEVALGAVSLCWEVTEALTAPLMQVFSVSAAQNLHLHIVIPELLPYIIESKQEF